jgi:predicted ABC-type sugar transport system permease subunit
MRTTLRTHKTYSRIIRQIAPFLSLGLMCIILAIPSPHFLTFDNLFAIGLQMAVVAIMAIGQTMVIISAGIDLSVGSVMALSGIATTMWLANGIPMLPAILIGLLIGLICGINVGMLIAWGHIPPFIATLGMMGIARGLALLFTGGVPIFGLPDTFRFLGGGHILKIFPVLIVILLALAGHFLLTRTQFGRYVFAIGSNTEAARLSGINVKKIWYRFTPSMACYAAWQESSLRIISTKRSMRLYSRHVMLRHWYPSLKKPTLQESLSSPLIRMCQNHSLPPTMSLLLKKRINTGVYVITKENVHAPEIQKLLNPEAVK